MQRHQEESKETGLSRFPAYLAPIKYIIIRSHHSITSCLNILVYSWLNLSIKITFLVYLVFISEVLTSQKTLIKQICHTFLLLVCLLL